MPPLNTHCPQIVAKQLVPLSEMNTALAVASLQDQYRCVYKQLPIIIIITTCVPQLVATTNSKTEGMPLLLPAF